MNRRVLIVSPHFPPVNAPDAQRVRMALPYLSEMGWDAVVLSVRPERVETPRDPMQAKTVPANISVHRANALSVDATRRFGVGSLALRSLPYLFKDGGRLLRESFDLVFFSTTLFPVTVLGPWWLKRWGIPYVVDFQDPWVSDYHNRAGAPEPPGGRKKYGLSQRLARWLEPLVVRRASHVITVSPDYPRELRRRYPEIPESRFTVLPFGAPGRDFEVLAQANVQQTIFNPHDGYRHWVYAGRGGADMAVALRGFFQALAVARRRDPKKWDALRLHFIGTDYAPGPLARKTVEPIAREVGVSDLLDERTGRVGYFETLACLRDAQALIVPGSDDPSYTASKIYTYILARKPLLAVFHEKSSVVDVLRKTGAGTVVTFSSASSTESIAKEIDEKWFAQGSEMVPPLDWTAFAPYTARAMTERLVAVFQKGLQRV